MRRRRTGATLVVTLLVLVVLAMLVGPVLTLATGARQRTDQERTRMVLAGRLRRLVLDVSGRPFEDLEPWAGVLSGWLEEEPPRGARSLRSRVSIADVGPGLLEIEAVLEWTDRHGAPRTMTVRRLRSRSVLTLEQR